MTSRKNSAPNPSDGDRRTRRIDILGRLVGVVIFVVCLLLFVAGTTNGLEIYHPTYGYFLDLPEGWRILDEADPSAITFASATTSALLTVRVRQAPSGDTAAALDQLLTSLNAEAETGTFLLNGSPAALADGRWRTRQSSVRGYVVTIDTATHEFALLAYAQERSWEREHDVLLSAIDSFASDTTARRNPGAMGQLLQPLQPTDGDTQAPVPLAGTRIRVPVSQAGTEGSQAVVEREARILSQYQDASGIVSEEAIAAWKRYYRMIYRESFARLRPIVGEIAFLPGMDDRDQIPSLLLNWLQDFTYTRTGTLADVTAPTACLTQGTGDCDSLGLTYAILLHLLGFDAILMVSDVYDHAMVGVDVAGEGARFPFENRGYLVAELTADVAIGQIDRAMSNINGWIGVRLGL